MVNKQYFYCTECGNKLEMKHNGFKFYANDEVVTNDDEASKTGGSIKANSTPACTRCGLEFEIRIDATDLGYEIRMCEV